MDDSITLRTSDDPPVELEVSRATLAVNSKVFADMLSSPQGASSTSQDSPINLAETQAELAPFLRLLNFAHDRGDPLKELEDKDWPVVARLADKYDSAPVRAVAIGKCWHWTALINDLSSAQHRTAFETAIKLGDGHLAASHLMRFMMRSGTDNIEEVVGEYRSAYDAWLGLLKAHAAFCALEEPSLEFCDDCTSNDASLADATWYSAMRESLGAWDPLKAAKPFLSIVHAMSSGLREDEVLCFRCETAFDRCAHSFEHHYQDTAPDFPV
ncbi:hypothetical protein JCM9279_002937 [Rhodotorula babjevae]